MAKKINPGRRMRPSRPGIDSLKRFMDKVEKGKGGCWNWTAFRDASGYGQFSDEGRVYWAHRWSLACLGGEEIPEGFEVDHTCRNPSCVNPQHLRTITMSENRRTSGR